MRLISGAELETVLGKHKTFYDRLPGGLRASLK